MTTHVFDPEAYPELSAVHDRTADRPDVERLFFPEGGLAQGADVNEAITRERTARKAIGDLIAADGDRLSGGDIIVDTVAGTVTISSGVIYLLGAPRAVPSKVLTSVPMTGDVEIGVRVSTQIIKAVDDDIYYGLVEGTEAFGEEGAVRTKLVFSWAFGTDGGAGEFYKYVLMRDGVVVAQDAPPTLSGVQRQIALYDYDAHGHYIVRGCQVSALGKNGTKRIFSIGAGTCNVAGYKVIRNTDIRYEVEEDPDLGVVDAEPHVFADGGTHTLTFLVNRPPVAAINTVIVQKQRTVTLVKGATNSVEALPDDSVVDIVSVVQGVTSFVDGVSWSQSGDNISWALGGAEPATGSSYDVTYQYLDAVTVDSFTADGSVTITVPTGVTDSTFFIGYDYKIPRHDRLCIRDDGSFVYIRGQSSPNPYPPLEPGDCLSLAVIKNDWFGVPVVVNDGTEAMSFAVLNRMRDRLADALNLTLIEKLKSSAISRAPGAALGVFVDPFWTDEYRDFGESQNAATFDGTLQLPIDPVHHTVVLPAPVMLPYTTEVSVEQAQVTACVKVAPYISFDPPSPSLKLTPARDFWTETEEVVTSRKRKVVSENTRAFGADNKKRIRTEKTVVRSEVKPLKYLREIDVDFRIDGFGAGETLSQLLFDGINVTPPGLVANASGVVTGTFTIPEKIHWGKKTVKAVGGSGAVCLSVFVGQGKLEREFVQITTIVQKQRDNPAAPIDEPDIFGGGRGDPPDPQAQSFVMRSGRHVDSIGLRFCAVGNRDKPVVIDLVMVGDDGFPTRQRIGQARIDMHDVVAGTWFDAPLSFPVFVPADTYVAFVVRTADPVHSISAASIGDFDAISQSWVTSQPYLTGTRYSGADGVAWVAHPKSDLTMRVKTCKMTDTVRDVAIGSWTVTSISDIMVGAEVLLPTAECQVIFKIELSNGSVFWANPDQNVELDAFFSGTVTITARLMGTTYASPVLHPSLLVTFGTMQTTATYIGLSWATGNPIKVSAVMSTLLPTGSSMEVQVDANDDTFLSMANTQSLAIDEGWIEKTFVKTSHSAPNGGRLKIVLNGTPAARPAVADLRAWTE